MPLGYDFNLTFGQHYLDGGMSAAGLKANEDWFKWLRTGLNHIQTTCVLLSVSVLFIALGILGRNWNMWLLLIAAFSMATGLTLILWHIINKKLYGSNADH